VHDVFYMGAFSLITSLALTEISFILLMIYEAVKFHPRISYLIVEPIKMHTKYMSCALIYDNIGL
jgi:hypothetical protein